MIVETAPSLPQMLLIFFFVSISLAVCECCSKRLSFFRPFQLTVSRYCASVSACVSVFTSVYLSDSLVLPVLFTSWCPYAL